MKILKQLRFKVPYQKMASSFFLALCCIFGLTGNGGYAETRGVSPAEIRIGYIPDLTGPSARGCRGHLWGMTHYFDEVNAAGGIHGRKITLFIEDGKYNPSIGLSAFKKLVLKDRVFAMIANMGSASVKAQLPLIEKYQMPLISPAVQSWWISNPPKKYIFSTMLSQGYCARVLIDYVVGALGDRQPRMGVLFVNTELGHASLKEIKDQAEMYGFAIQAEVSYAPGSVSLSGHIAKLKEEDVHYVMLCGITTGAVYACKEAAKINWKPQFLFPGVVTDESIFTLGRDVMFYGKPPIGASEYFPVSSDFPAKDILLKWLKNDPKKKMISLYDLQGYTYAKTLAEGLRRSGKDLSVEGLVNTMEGIKNWENGAQAPLSFGPGNRQGVTKVIILQGVRESEDEIGRWKIIQTWTGKIER